MSQPKEAGPGPESSRTKIVTTLGPALDAPDALEALLAEGVDVLRVNLAHGGPEAHRERVRRARAAHPEVAVLADLAGPKLRVGDFQGRVELGDGQEVTLGQGGIPVDIDELPSRVRPGDPIYLADGSIQLEVLEAARERVRVRVVVGGRVSPGKGINLPEDRSEAPALTDDDRRCLERLDAIAPDLLAVSYVRHEDDLAHVRERTSLPLIAKIERAQAVERMEPIVDAADGLMVARGDLGVEVPIERVPAVQKRLIRAANAAGKPVITATQMLVSMVERPLPTRAEVTDVANAVLDGTDAVMLSEETATGRHPARVVRMMRRILAETEPLRPRRWEGPPRDRPGRAIARAAVSLAHDLGAAAILIPTLSGSSAARVAAYRPEVPVLAFSPRPETRRRLRLVWGVRTVEIETFETESAMVDRTLARARRLLPAGARVVLLAGWPSGTGTFFTHTAEL